MLVRVIRAGMWIFLGLLLGRVLGLCRDLLLANRLGASSLADTATVLLTIPDTLLQLLVGGAMSAAIIPRIQGLNQSIARKLVTDLSRLLAIVSCGLTIAAILASEFVVEVFAPGLSEQTKVVANRLVPFVLCTIPLGIATSLSTAWLQANDRFFVTSFGTVIYSSFIVCGLLLAENELQSVEFMAIGILSGALFRFLSQAVQAPGIFSSPHFFSRCHTFDLSLLKNYFEALACGGALFLIPVIARALATFEGSGSLALLNFAYKLVELPNGLLLSIFAVAILPTVSRIFQSSDKDEKATTYILDSSLVVLLMSMSVSSLLALFSHDISNLLYFHGQMDQKGVGTIADLAQVWFLALPFAGVSSISTVAYQAQRNTRTPMLIGVFGLVLFCICAPFSLLCGGLHGLVSIVLLVHVCIFFLHLYWLKKLYGIDLFGFFSKQDCLRAIFVQLGLIAAGSLASSQFSLPAFRLIGMVLTGSIAFFVALLSVPRYRKHVLDTLRSKTRTSKE